MIVLLQESLQIVHQGDARTPFLCHLPGSTHCVAASDTTFDVSRPGVVSGS
jgi:hypothetical protein